MPHYRDREARGDPDEIIVIEDKTLMKVDARGQRHPGYEYVDENTIRAHPFIIAVLLVDAERIWDLEEMLQELEADESPIPDG